MSLKAWATINAVMLAAHEPIDGFAVFTVHMSQNITLQLRISLINRLWTQVPISNTVRVAYLIKICDF